MIIKQVLLTVFFFNSLSSFAQKQMLKKDSFITDYKIPFTFLGKQKAMYFHFAGGLSYGPEHIFGIPTFNASIQSHHKKGLYAGVQFGTIAAFTLTHGFHTGMGYKWFTVDYAQTAFRAEKNRYFTHNLKLGINFWYIWLKCGPSIINNDFNTIDKQYLNNNKYMFNVELLISNRMSNE